MNGTQRLDMYVRSRVAMWSCRLRPDAYTLRQIIIHGITTVWNLYKTKAGGNDMWSNGFDPGLHRSLLSSKSRPPPSRRRRRSGPRPTDHGPGGAGIGQPRCVRRPPIYTSNSQKSLTFSYKNSFHSQRSIPPNIHHGFHRRRDRVQARLGQGL